LAYNANNPNGQAVNADSAPVTLSTEQQAQLEAIKTSVQLLDNAISGSEMQVDIVTMPTVTIQDGGGSITVDGVFYQATQPVSLASVPSHPVTNAGTFAVQSTNQANSGVDIGDVTINNASGASAVNIQDGGNSITVDGTITANAGTNLNTSALALEATQLNIYSSIGAIEADIDAMDTNVAAILARTTIDQDLRNDSTDMTITALNSLASSATVGWQSDRVVISTELDVLIMVSLNPESTAPAGSKAAYVYLIPWYYDGTTWYPSTLGTTTLPTGTQGTCTIAAQNNLKLLGVLMYTATNQDIQDSFLISNAFGNRLPDGWSVEITNDTGSALRSSGNSVKYKKINQQTV